MMRGSILLLICLCFASASGSRESTGVEERQGRISAISRQASLQPAVKTGDKLAGLRASGHLVHLLHSALLGSKTPFIGILSAPTSFPRICVPPMLYLFALGAHISLSQSKHSPTHVCFHAQSNAESRREQTFLSSGYFLYGRRKNSMNGQTTTHCRRKRSISGGVLWRKPAIWTRARSQ